MYAVIETGGKQHIVELGTELEVELLDVEPGQEISLERVLFVADGEETAIGRPVVTNAAVNALVLRHDRGEKTISFKYRPKARRRVKKGHRQELTVLRITDVRLGDHSAAADAQASEAEAETERKRIADAAARQAAEDAALAAKLAERTRKSAETEGEAPEAEAKPKRRSRKTEAAEPESTELTQGAEPVEGAESLETPVADTEEQTETPESAAPEATGEDGPGAKKRTRTKKDE